MLLRRGIFFLITLLFSGAFSMDMDKDANYSAARKHFQNVYAPIVKVQTKVDLKVELIDDSPDEAPSVSWMKTYVVISVGRQFPQVSKISVDGYVAALCHEIGHVLGGTPNRGAGRPQENWNSNFGPSIEAQSDYYAALVCMKKVFAVDTSSLANFYKLPKPLQERCHDKFRAPKDRNICARSILAGYDLFDFMYRIYRKYGQDPYMGLPDMLATEKPGFCNQKMYPSLQCRFDTILNGALNKERPSCWYPYLGEAQQ